jgi:hypothetical protein
MDITASLPDMSEQHPSSNHLDIVELTRFIINFFFIFVGICYIIKFNFGTGTRQSQIAVEVTLSLMIVTIMFYYLVLASTSMTNGYENKSTR